MCVCVEHHHYRGDHTAGVLRSGVCWELRPCFLYVLDLNETAEQQYDALLMSNVVPMYPEFKSESGVAVN